MARIQTSLTPSEVDLVDQLATLTQSKRTDVIRNALAVYHWFLTQAITGARIMARQPSGEEVCLETLELAVLQSQENRLSPDELGELAEQLSECSDPKEVARLKERLTRGFYGT